MTVHAALLVALVVALERFYLQRRRGETDASDSDTNAMHDGH